MSAPRVLGRARVDDAAGIPLPDLLSELPERALGDNCERGQQTPSAVLAIHYRIS